MPVKVLDSWALLAFLQDEPSAGVVEKLLLDAADGNTLRGQVFAFNFGFKSGTVTGRGLKNERDREIRSLDYDPKRAFAPSYANTLRRASGMTGALTEMT